MATLQVYFGGTLLSELRLDETAEYAAGRSPDCRIVIDNLAVSRCHCIFRFARGQWMLEDQKSSNGTFVNGHRVALHRLRHRDRIVLGKHTLLFEDSGGDHNYETSFARPAEAGEALAALAGKGDRTHFIGGDVAAQFLQRSQKEQPLVLVLEGRNRRRVPLEKDIILIGRAPHCDLRINGWFIKGEQALVVKERHGFRIFDQGGLRAMRINGAKRKEAFLHPGDVISIGNNRISLGSL